MSNSPLKKINYLRETVDKQTGEVTEVEREGIIDREPDYVKLYLSGILMYADCPGWQNRVLHALLKRINFQNEISLPAGYKREIVNELNISMSSLNNAVSAFVKSKILIRKDIGVYTANPHLFGRGEWKHIRKLRLTVDFSPEGLKMQGDVERDSSSSNSSDSTVENTEIANVLASSLVGVNPAKLIEFLKNPENHSTDLIAASVTAFCLCTSYLSLYQLFS